MGEIDPNLTDGQRQDVLNTARVAWKKSGIRRRMDCAEDYLHPYLNHVDRTKVIDRLEDLDELGAPAIVELLTTIEHNENELKRLQDEVTTD